MTRVIVFVSNIAALFCAVAGMLVDDVQRSILFWVLFLVNIYNADRLER